MFKMTQWKLFFTLLVAAIFGALAFLPYFFELLLQINFKPSWFFITAQITLSVVINIFFIFIGLFSAKKVGLGCPLLQDYFDNKKIDTTRWQHLLQVGVVSGALTGLVIIAVDYICFSQMAAIVETTFKPALWKLFLVAFKGGICEEIFIHLFLMTTLIWLFFKIKKSTTSIWLAIIIAAIVLGLTHLSVSSIIGVTNNQMIIMRFLILNGIVGIVCGWLYWKNGLESSMVAHFTSLVISLMCTVLIGYTGEKITPKLSIICNICNNAENILDVPKLLQKHAENTPTVGIAVGLIDKGVIRYYVYGKKDSNKNDLIDEHTIFEIGSVTKVFTTLALAEIVREGKIALDDPIERFLPDIKVPQKNGIKITFRHLATHTSGLPRLPDNMKMKDPQNPYADYTTQDLYAFLNAHTLAYAPGEHLEYSNLGMGLLGHLLERITHKSYETVLKELVTNNLHMHDTTITLSPDQKKRLARGHVLYKHANNWDLPALAGAGALRSNIVDMTQFLAANMGLINTTLYESMKTTHTMQHQATQDLLSGAGLGWSIVHKNDSTIICHDGQTGGYHSFIGFDTQRQRGVVILVNSTGADQCINALSFYLIDQKNYHKKSKQMYWYF